MCGICGFFDLESKNRINAHVIAQMTETLYHRGPDGMDCFLKDNIALGFTRLSIIDLEGGMQPLFNENQSIVMICNGEIFNYIELRQELEIRGHIFKTKTDVEVLIHLYEEEEIEFLNRINGQFSFVIFDLKKKQLFCARDHFGVLPFFYTVVDGLFIFGSEIKAILKHPAVKPEVDLVGLDQVFTFPGLISPRTMFKNILSLANGHYLSVNPAVGITDKEYWDVIYPEKHNMSPFKNEGFYIEKLRELLTRSIRLRLRSDVPVGVYISGGLDSSIISAIAHLLIPDRTFDSFSIYFQEKEISEYNYQNIMSRFIKSNHHEILFQFSDIGDRLKKAVYHCECAIKESYNTASLALSESVRTQDIKVILSGEGSDEFFAGYPGYRFDKMRQAMPRTITPGMSHEDEIRKKLWGDNLFFYERNKYSFGKIKREIYSEAVNRIIDEVDCVNHFVVNKERLHNRDNLQRRSYLDYKLRLADHLISDHGDRMAMANSVEVRYPFLDKDLIEFALTVPSDLKLMDFKEKYILKEMSTSLIPPEITKREKFGFVAPGSPYLLKRNIEYIDDLLSFETIKRQGFFNPRSIEKIKAQYMKDNFVLNLPFDSDLLMIVLTLGILVEEFKLPDFS